MKKILGIIVIVVIAAIAIPMIFGGGDQHDPNGTKIGDYDVVIEGCRVAKDYSGNDIVIVTFKYTNNSDEPKAFLYAVDDNAFQNGIGLTTCYVAEGYKHEEAEKEIQPGATLTVEQAYVLNDTTTDLTIEITEWASFNDKKITKTLQLP